MESKQAYQEKMQAQFKEWNAKVDVLKAKAEKVQAGAKADIQEQIKKLREKQQQMQKNLDGLQKAGEGAWDNAKQSVETAWEDMKNAVSSAQKRINK